MTQTWTDDLPIYRQLMNEIIIWILSGKLNDGDPLPSARKLALQYEVNPLTAVKAYQELASNKVLDKQRGIGIFVREGAAKMLRRTEKRKFIREEWPAIVRRMKLMGVDPRELIESLEE